MPTKLPRSAGGWRSIWYTLVASHRVGGVRSMMRSLRAKNACKTCALGMGGQKGGMTNEAGRFPEVCKKSFQAMAADMQGRIRDGFFREFTFSKLQRLSPRELETAGRLTQPLYAGPGDDSYRPISWDEALDRTAAAMNAASPDDTFFYLSGRSSNEAAFLLQLTARLYGTNNVNNCSYLCHQASGVALASAIGNSTATITLDDLDHSDFVMLIGGNPASNHPRLMRTLLDLRRRKGKIVVVNPIRELGLVNFAVPSDPWSLVFGTKIADEYVQPHIGGDIAFLYGMAKSLIESGAAIDSKYISDHTEGFEEFRTGVGAVSWEEIEKVSGVARAQIEQASRLYAESRSAVFCWTMGITHHLHGTDNVRMISNLALASRDGRTSRRGSASSSRSLKRAGGRFDGRHSGGSKSLCTKAIESHFRVTLPTGKGLDTLESVERSGQGRIRFALLLGGNLYGACPDAGAAERALRQIGLTVFMSTSLNTGHIHGRGRESIILPVRARDEEEQSTTQESMFSFVRVSEGGPQRHPGLLSEVQIITALAHRVFGDKPPIDFGAMENHDNIRAAIAAVIPGYEAIGQIGRSKEEFHVPGRAIREPSFSTPTGRARFQVPPLPGRVGGPGLSGSTLRLMTIRSEGQFNTVVYDDDDAYRGQERRDVILMSREDITRIGLKEDDRVTVSNQTGSMANIIVREFDIRSGNAAMYCPEANVLIPSTTDPESRTPAFKNALVQVSKTVSLPLA